jgi:DNA-binding HxlR family transcriptional regulator
VKSEALLRVIGKKCALRVLEVLNGKELFFTEIVRRCGCSPSTVSLRLKEFEEAQLVNKKILHPRAVMYTITDKGAKIQKILLDIDKACRRIKQ